MRRFVPILVGVLAFAPVAHAGTGTIVELRPGGTFMAEPLLRAAGATEISPTLAMWRVPAAPSARVVAALRRANVLQLVQPDRTVEAAAVPRAATDPLEPVQWSLSVIGATSATPPGPGVPVGVVDTGVDLGHPEFSARPNTTALNPQSTTDTNEDLHGTAVASVVGAPANGVGIVGVYPQAALRLYDADLNGRLTDAAVIAGIEAAASGGRTVINLSLGGTQQDPALQNEIYSVFRRGSIVVAASGNSREEGNPINFPANMSHVLTVAATDRSDHPASFSSSSPGVDLAAPGVEIETAVPVTYNAGGYEPLDGTSFSAPMVSAATAWVWTARPALTNTQLFDLMRWSARDVGAAGFDQFTGFGVLDIPQALSFPAPPNDPQEPNDDIVLVRPNGLFLSGNAALTTPAKGTSSLKARLDFTEDPEDVYRLYVPAKRALVVGVKGDRDVDLELWRNGTRSVREHGNARRRDLAGSSAKRGTATDTVTLRNAGTRGAYFYADVFLGRNVGDADYTLSVRTTTLAKP